MTKEKEELKDIIDQCKIAYDVATGIQKEIHAELTKIILAPETSSENRAKALAIFLKR